MPTSRKTNSFQQLRKNPITNLPKKELHKTTKQQQLPPIVNITQKPPPIITKIETSVQQPVIRLPPIKDHVIKQNLTLKPALRCKTPRPISAYSFTRSNTIPISEPEGPTKNYHPLQGMNVGSLLSESARHRLKRLFKRLDTDQDGHLTYTQVQRCLPASLSRAQVTFFRVFYDIISDVTFFGLQEFYATAIIVEIIAKQDSKLWNSYLDDVDFNYYRSNILELIEEYNTCAYSDIGLISYEKLIELIRKNSNRTIRIETIINQLEYLVPNIRTMQINRLDFISFLPIIIYLQSCFDHERKLFRFREHSLLDLPHIRQALIT